jgi:hypothetical protein
LGALDYRHLAEEYPCVPGALPAAPPTNAPAYLGAVVAGLMAAECARILAGRGSPESHEIALELDHGRSLISRLRRSPRCRFDHQIVREIIELRLPIATATVGKLLAAIEHRFGRAPIFLECRRGLRLLELQDAWPSRFIDLDRLRWHSDRKLADIGFDSDDRIRVRLPDHSTFIALIDSRNEE